MDTKPLVRHVCQEAAKGTKTQTDLIAAILDTSVDLFVSAVHTTCTISGADDGEIISHIMSNFIHNATEGINNADMKTSEMIDSDGKLHENISESTH